MLKHWRKLWGWLCVRLRAGSQSNRRNKAITEVTEQERDSSFLSFKHTKVSSSFLTKGNRRGYLQTLTSLVQERLAR